MIVSGKIDPLSTIIRRKTWDVFGVDTVFEQLFREKVG